MSGAHSRFQKFAWLSMLPEPFGKTSPASPFGAASIHTRSACAVSGPSGTSRREPSDFGAPSLFHLSARSTTLRCGRGPTARTRFRPRPRSSLIRRPQKSNTRTKAAACPLSTGARASAAASRAASASFGGMMTGPSSPRSARVASSISVASTGFTRISPRRIPKPTIRPRVTRTFFARATDIPPAMSRSRNRCTSGVPSLWSFSAAISSRFMWATCWRYCSTVDRSRVPAASRARAWAMNSSHRAPRVLLTPPAFPAASLSR